MRELFVVDRPAAFFSCERQSLRDAPTSISLSRALPGSSKPAPPFPGCAGRRASEDEDGRDGLCSTGALVGNSAARERTLARTLCGFYWAGWTWGWSCRGPAAVWVTSYGLAFRRHVSRRLGRIPIRTIEVHDSGPGPVGVAPLLCVTWSDGNDRRESAFAVSRSPVETRRWGDAARRGDGPTGPARHHGAVEALEAARPVTAAPAGSARRAPRRRAPADWTVGVQLSPSEIVTQRTSFAVGLAH
jgi:hypothetical protein